MGAHSDPSELLKVTLVVSGRVDTGNLICATPHAAPLT